MTPPLIQIRTPTYRRPEALRRALQSVRDQNWDHWVVDVFDDDPDCTGRRICADFGDPRIRYHANSPQRFASRNIDACFSARNPNDADYFCVLEDDNFLLPGFFKENVRLCREHNVEIVLRNQLIEHQSATPTAHLSKTGVLDQLFTEGLYAPEVFRLSLLIGIGVSNGGLFWSRMASSKLEIGFACTATVQEYLRTFSVNELIYVALTPLAVWAENADQTTRNAELRASYLRRELDLKRQIQALQRLVWWNSSPTARAAFFDDARFVPPAPSRAKSLAKALISCRVEGLGAKVLLEMLARGAAIRALGRLSPQFQPFVESRKAAVGDA
jgi:hypothetical protein